MKIRILKGTTALHGKAVAEGEILEVDEATFHNLAQYNLAEKFIEPVDVSVEYSTTSIAPEEITKRIAPKGIPKKGK